MNHFVRYLDESHFVQKLLSGHADGSTQITAISLAAGTTKVVGILTRTHSADD